MLRNIRMSSVLSYRPMTSMAMPGALPMAFGYPGTLSLQAQQVEAEHFKNMGNEFRRLRMYDKAVDAYENAIQVNPRYTDAFFNYAQLMVLVGNVPKGIELMTRLLYINPNDHDARGILGEYYEKIGHYTEAKRRYMEILSIKPDFDPARRRLEFLLFQDQRRFFPETADQLLKTRYRETIHKARELLKTFYTVHHPNPILLKLSQEIPIVFEETQSVGESANIAEWDARRQVIRVQPAMLFSTHNVVGAYLAHELIHALDGDSRTSVWEEQDGYKELAKFWRLFQGAENDPNLDRALELYNQGRSVLEQEVRRVYTIRDPYMPERSPGHGLPSKSPWMNAYLQYEQKAATVQPEQFDKLQQLKNSIIGQIQSSLPQISTGSRLLKSA